MGRIEQERVHEVRNELRVVQQQRLISSAAAVQHPMTDQVNTQIGDESRVHTNNALLPVANAQLRHHHAVGIQWKYGTRNSSLSHYVAPPRKQHVYDRLREAKL